MFQPIDAITKLWKKADNTRKDWLENLIRYAYSQVLSNREIIGLIYGKEKIPMEDWIERMKASRRKENRELKKKAIKEGRKEGRKEGVKEGVKETIRLIVVNMLKENQDENTIMRYTNANKEEIEEIRREVQLG